MYFQLLAGAFSNRKRLFSNWRRLLFYGSHRRGSHVLLIGGFGVPLNLSQGFMAANRRNLTRAASGLGQPPTHGLAQAMRTQATQSGLVA